MAVRTRAAWWVGILGAIGFPFEVAELASTLPGERPKPTFAEDG